MKDLRACFRRIDITPDRPVSLLGYFTERISEGILDPLHCRLAALYQGDASLLFVQVDTCLMGARDAKALAAAVSRSSGIPPERIMVFASHTHTAPALADLYAVKRDGAYFDFLVSKAAEAAATLQPESRVLARICRGRAPGLASNRRWFLKTGGVATNPPRLHPSLDRPEGPVDEEVNTVSFHDSDGDIVGLFVSASNHVDTIGGNRISADWPGIMESEMRAALGRGAVVIPFTGAAGNINHLDFTRTLDQTSYAEAKRIGAAYAAAALASLGNGVETGTGALSVVRRLLRVPAIEISAGELQRARQLVSGPAKEASGRDLTAEDIFHGDPAVECAFARTLIALAETRREEYEIPLQVFRVNGVVFFAIPGEPFVEVGLRLKSLAGFDLAVPVGLANGYFGYMPLRECFERGGYEVKPGPAVLCRGAADRVVAALQEMAAVEP